MAAKNKNRFHTGLYNPTGFDTKGKVDISFVDHFSQALRWRLDLNGHQRGTGLTSWNFNAKVNEL